MNYKFPLKIFDDSLFHSDVANLGSFLYDQISSCKIFGSGRCATKTTMYQGIHALRLQPLKWPLQQPLWAVGPGLKSYFWIRCGAASLWGQPCTERSGEPAEPSQTPF